MQVIKKCIACSMCSMRTTSIVKYHIIHHLLSIFSQILRKKFATRTSEKRFKCQNVRVKLD